MRFWFQRKPEQAAESAVPLTPGDAGSRSECSGRPAPHAHEATESPRDGSAGSNDDVGRNLVRLGDAIDYLATPAVAAYFDVREHEAYYRALKRVGARRDFHERLITVIDRFLRAIESESGMASVDRVLATAARRRQAPRSSSGSLVERARAQSPKGVEYLALSDPVTFDSLKAAYRLAAKRNHPDAGGTHDAMVAVNEAFQLVHDLLREEHIMAEGGLADADAYMRVDGDGNLIPLERPATAADYRYVVCELRFRVALDDWELDVAADALRRLRSAEWLDASKYARDEQQLLALTEPAGKLAERLALTPWRTDAEAALEIARAGLAVANRMGLNFEYYVVGPEAVLSGAKVPRVVVSHPRQAKNALRLGLIDATKARRVDEKYAAEEGGQAAVDAEGEAFRASTGFLQDLPVDAVVHGKVARSKLVPEPQYYQTKIETLSDDQQAEYAVAFGPRGTAELTRKYAFVRLVSILESVAFFPDRVDAAAAAREATVIGSLVRSPYAGQVADAIMVLAAQPAAERTERASLLRDIAAGHGRAAHAGIVITVGGGSLSVPLTQDYFKIVTGSLPDLRVLRSTGRLVESAEDRREREAWNVEADWLRSDAVVASEQRAWAADERAKSDPAEGIPGLEAHCTMLLELGARMTHVEQLQLGYWLDRLTTALMKAKRSDETRRWIERWFALPERYRGRSPQSESERLRSRLARASKVRR